MFLRLLLIIVLFSNWLEEWIPLFTFTDEILALVLPILGLIKIVTVKKHEKVFTNLEVLVFILISIVSFIGVISTIFSNVDTTFPLQIYTLFADVKYILIYFGARILLRYYVTNSQELYSFIAKLSYLFALLSLSVFVLDLIFNFMQGYSNRFGLKNVAYGFGHPAEFSLCIILLTALNLYFSLRFKHKINYIYVILNLLLLFTAGRVTALAFYITLILLILFFRYFRRYVFIGAVVSFTSAIIFTFNKFNETFINVQEPRGILMVTSLDIAKRFFPFGSGLGTFGSNASRTNYSELYYQYGFDKIWGLAPWHDVFLTDSYWAMIIGEYGLIASFINLIALLLLLVNSYYISKGIFGVVIFSPILYIVINTPVDTTIVANSSLPLMFVAALLISLRLTKFNNTDRQ